MSRAWRGKTRGEITSSFTNLGGKSGDGRQRKLFIITHFGRDGDTIRRVRYAALRGGQAWLYCSYVHLSRLEIELKTKH